MGYTLGKVGKGRTIAVGRREDAGTNEGKGDRGRLAGPLLNFAMPWATAGAAGITIIAGCPSLCLVIYRIVYCYFVIVIVIVRRRHRVISPVVIIVIVIVHRSH